MPALPPPARPLLSVIVPMFQSAATIAYTLRSIQHDPLDGLLEIIVVNDGSTDEGPSIAARAAALDHRIRIVNQSNHGLAAARNTGIAHARGRWLRFLDADDLALPRSSRRLIDHAQRTGSPAACGPHALIAESGEPLDRTCTPRSGSGGVIGLNELLTGNCLGVGTLVIRASALGPDRFDPTLRVCEDWDLWLRLARRGLRIAACPGDPVKLYRVRRASLSKDFAGMLRTGAAILQSAFRHARDSADPAIDASPRRESAALHRLALEWATMAALADAPDRLATAESMLDGVALPTKYTISAADAAESVFWAVLLGLGARPESPSDHTWIRRAGEWWSHCTQRGRMSEDAQPLAWNHLASLLPTPSAIAHACLDAAPNATGLVIIGAGQNGHALARAARDRNLPFELRDDNRAPHTTPIDAPIPEGWRVIVSPLNDEAICQRVPDQAPIRWRTTRDILAKAQSAHLFSTLHSPLCTQHSALSTTTLTTIIPLYNSAATVAETIRSVQSQNIDGLRIIVVNDGSTDTGPAIVEELAHHDPRITIISQPNRGLAGARNTGIEAALQAGTEFLHFLDADDRMRPGAYTALLRAATHTGAAYGGYTLINERGDPLGRESPISAPLVGLDEELEWNRAATHARLLSAQALGADRFDERLPVCEDYDLWLRLETRGIRFQAVEQLVCDYRLRPTSLSKKFADMCRIYQEVTRQAFHAARPNWESRIDLSDARFRRVVGHSALMYATMEALLDPDPEKSRAADLLRAAARPDRFSPANLAQAACTAILFGSCAAPAIDGRAELQWLPPLAHWWSRCERENWCEPEATAAAIEELARKVIHPDDIASAMLDAAACATPMPLGLAIIGLDRNSRRLARLAASRGTRTLILDDAASDAEAALLEPIPLINVVRDPASFAAIVANSFPRARWLTGASAIDRIAAAANISPSAVDRWNTTRDRLGAANLALLRAALTPIVARTTPQPSPA